MVSSNSNYNSNRIICNGYIPSRLMVSLQLQTKVGMKAVLRFRVYIKFKLIVLKLQKAT